MTPWVGPWLRWTAGVIEVELTLCPPWRETLRPTETLGERSALEPPTSFKAFGLGRKPGTGWPATGLPGKASEAVPVSDVP